MFHSRLVAALLLPVLWSPVATATNSQAELQGVLNDLLAWWPGEYDSLPQVELERAYGEPPDGEHDRQYRVFARVDVPHIGEHVIYGEVHTGGRDGPLIKGQQVLYILTIDAEHQVVSVSGRRIKDGAQYERAYLHPEKLKTIALDPNYGGNCDFRFQRYGMQLRGWLANTGAPAVARTCTMTSKTSGQTMTWDADWAITPEEIWIFDNGYLLDPAQPDKPGRLFAGREDLTYERLYKARTFLCSVGAPGKPRVKDAPVLDRGGELALAAVTNHGGTDGRRARLLRMPMAVGSPAVLADFLTLTIFDEADGPPVAEARAPVAANAISLEHGNDVIACRLNQ
ncbi:MAG: hypothetical protein R3F58_11290 [Steroidobacteraceae bacterium]